MEKCQLVEIFSSIQGEGVFVGCRQVFVRFAGCNISCDYCDTASSRILPQRFRVEQTPGKRDFVLVSNPIDIDGLAVYINQLLVSPHHSVSLTGGEPLCQADMLCQLLPRINGVIYLETNGTMPDQLIKIIDNVNIVSMDIKLPSCSGNSFWEQHREFLRIAKKKDVFVKMVVSGETDDWEIEQALQLITSIDKRVPLILQPITPINNCPAISPERVQEIQERALHSLYNVRVIPQTHKYLGQL